MLVRVVSAAVMLSVFIPCLLFSHLWIFDAVITLLCLMACFEMLRCIKLHKAPFVVIPALLLSVFIPLCVRLIDTGISFFELLVTAFVIFMFIVLGMSVFSHGRHKINDASLGFTMIFYIVFGFSSILAIRGSENGQFLYLLIFMSAWISDTGAYFAGVLFGKHKLIPDVSPKKTVEGAVGGLLFCVVSFAVFGVIMQNCYGLEPNYLILCALGLVMSVVSMCGDLVASLVKRQFDVKDYSKLIPGHGGIMDRFDSIIATASLMFVVINIPFISQNLL